MWNCILWIALLVGHSSAGVASWSDEHSVHNNLAVTGIHYSQHESSVNAARRAAAERLKQSQDAVLVVGGIPCYTICRASFSADGASDAETIGQGIVGFTSTGSGTVGSSQKYSSSSSRMSESSSSQRVLAAQPIIYPASSSSGTRSSYTSSSSSSQQHSLNQAQPAVGALYSTEHVRTLSPQSHGSQSSYNERLSSERTVVSRPVVANVVYTSAPGVSSSSNNYNTRSSFVASSNEQQHVQPVTYPVGNSEYSRRYTTQQDHQQRHYPAAGSSYVLYSKPIASSVQYYAPSRSRVDETATSYDSSGRVINLNVLQPTERVNEQRTQHHSESAQTVQRQHEVYPVRGGQQDNLEEDEYDTTQRYVVHTPAPVASSSSSSNQRREQQNSYVRTGSYVPNTGSTNRHSSAQSAEGQRRQTYHSSPTYVDAGPVSSSKYESASESQQERHSTSNAHITPVVIQPVPVGASSTASRYATQEHRSSTHSGAGSPTYYAPSGSAAYGSQYSNTASSSSHSSRHKAGSGGSFVHYPITNDDFGRRFGATGGSGGFGADTDLQDIMSESESLARLQAQNVHNGAVAGSSTIDANTRFGGNADSEGLGMMPGGFQRTKSWSSSSKWASEQRYGDDGKPKSFSMLSTAESEKHNINGKTTGYKAATTTLEDDGKVSTYSLHTT